MRPEYISNELFHFLGRASPEDHENNYSVLKTVLSTGCISHPPHEVNWGTVSYSLDLEKRLALEQMLVPTVTCYCDIPFPQLGPHLSKYGNFGVSFSRHHLTKFGARPVTYVPLRPDDWTGVFTGHTMLKELQATFVGIHEQREILANQFSEVVDANMITKKPATVLSALQKAEHTMVLRVLAFIKPYESTLDDSDPRYYYSEREWRKLGNFKFEPEDIIRIIVDQTFLERAKKDFPKFENVICASP
jgi:Putative abortive phage resistance protein AbiGi, antitoxin